MGPSNQQGKVAGRTGVLLKEALRLKKAGLGSSYATVYGWDGGTWRLMRSSLVTRPLTLLVIG